jgi:hypothetical protein
MNVFRTYYEDEGDQGAGDGGTPPEPKTFTQEQLDKIIGERLKKTKLEQDKLLGQLTTLQKNQNLSVEEKATLQQHIDDLTSSLSTKEEIAAKEKKELEQKHAKDLDAKSKEAEAWRSRFTTSTIERALIDAAVEHKAVRPQQLVDLLGTKTRLVEEFVDGRSTGRFIPQIKFEGRDKDGKSVLLDLPVKDAVKQMKEEVDTYGNLFLSDATGGVGQTTTPGGNRGNVNLLDTATYIAQRKKGLKLEQVRG